MSLHISKGRLENPLNYMRQFTAYTEKRNIRNLPHGVKK